MMIVKVKICGITNYQDAAAAVEMGADMIGFNFYPKSPRYITPEDAAAIINKLPTFVDTVGVFVNESFERILEIINSLQLNWIQLHGDETPEFCQNFLSINVKTIKAIRIKTKADIQKADAYFTDAIILDAFRSDIYGGTGETFD